MIGEIIDSLLEIVKEDIPETKRENFIFPGKFGDLSCNIAFVIAKSLKKTPNEVSHEFAPKISRKLPQYIERAEASGGYINFYFNYSALYSGIVGPKMPRQEGKKILVEFSNPNPCKAMHIGHARTTFLGDSISEILKFEGNKAIRANYYNDLGKQFAKSVFAAKKYGINGNKKPDHELADIYVRLHKDLKKSPDMEKEIQDILNRLEKGDKSLDKIKEQVLGLAVGGFEETYLRLGVKFDTIFYESDFRAHGKALALEMEKKGLAFKSDEGTLVANLEKAGLPNTVLLRSDGTGLYITSDLSLTVYRFEEFGLDQCVWVVGSDQNLYFQQMFKIFELLGYPFFRGCSHMSYGMVTLQGSKMSSRAGEFILLDELMDEVVEKAGEEVIKRHPEMHLDDVKKTANMIGIGALKYEILKVERNKGVDFNPKKAIEFEGNTGPYIQYMAVRCGAILKKSRQSVSGENTDVYRPKEQEKDLMRKILEFEGAAKRAAEQLKPNLICNYAFELATLFSKFYEHCQVVGSDKEEYRRPLVKKTRDILADCLTLLRIEVPEVM